MLSSSQRYLMALAIAASICILVLTPAAVNAADPVGNGYWYSFTKNDCRPSQIKDPVTVFFWGSAATTRKLAGYERGGPFQKDVYGEITRHTFWTRHNSDNFFRQSWEPFDCKTNPGDTDLATRSGYGNSRAHLRMWQWLPAGRNTRGAVVLTPHVEDWTRAGDCGTVELPVWGNAPGSHAVERGAVDRTKAEREKRGSGFDRARYYFYRAYRRSPHRHEIGYSTLGNTRSIKQCDREYAGSNGNSVDIGIGRVQCAGGGLPSSCRQR